MRYRKINLLLVYKLFVCLSAFICLFLSSCEQKDPYAGSDAKKQLKVVDSIFILGKDDSAVRLLMKIRPQMNGSDPAITIYYTTRAGLHINNPAKMNLYADSALAFFNTAIRINQYPNEYFQSLLAKGDACLKDKKYIAALNYYYKAKTVLAKGKCDNGELDNKMGSIYYAQKNFIMAARYWSNSYNRIKTCHKGVSTEKLFGTEQAALNNTGFSYERAGVLDSAGYYYIQDLKLINHADSIHLSTPKNIADSRVIIYDNLGGLNLKRGNYAIAEDYLNKCLAIPTANVNGIKIPPLLKFADLCLKTGNNAKAAIAFNESKLLLNRFAKDNKESEIKWYKLYTQYLYKSNQTASAYLYQDRYIKLRDSVDNSSADLYRLDVERELSGISQKQQLIEFEQRDKIKVLYLVGISMFVCLFVIIIILINRNLKRSQKSHHTATLQNQQLQLTLDELELVNKNYIRIMQVMAHDLRNPLSGITGLTAMLLEEDEFTEENKTLLKLIETTGIHAMDMINELLKSGLADENEPLPVQAIDVQSLLFDSVELLRFRANEKQQQLIFDSDNMPIMANVTHEKIWRVFNNLIVNAIKFSYERSDIKIGIHRRDDKVLIYVADNGIGIPEKDKEKIFEMFTPAKKAGTNGEEPFGLGLSIAKRIIDKHKGKIWFENNDGGGVVFYIELPAL